jgi:eukaryotic-like serine/threonine-protein kinase
MPPTDVMLFDDASAIWEQLAGRVERFVDAWEAGPNPPSLVDHLTEVPETQRRLTAIELIKIDLEYRWLKRKEPRYIEAYLTELPFLAADPPVDLLYEEFHIRRQAGETAGPNDLLKRFPNQADELRRLLGAGKALRTTTMVHRDPTPIAKLQPGDRVDDFDLLSALGEGAFGSVYLARQRSMQRIVALKVTADRGSEPQTLAQLDHENIIRVYDQRRLEDRGIRLMYMQFASGGTLEAVVDRLRKIPPEDRTGRDYLKAVDAVLIDRGEDPPAESSLRMKLSDMSWPELISWLGSRLAQALDYAHGVGVLHRDIKPANVLLTAEGSPKLADFNISFSSKVDGATPAAYFGGSLTYMSPEQLEACSPAHDRTPDELDGRSDLYSLGVMLWELLTGFRPFEDERVERSWNLTLQQMIARRQKGVSSRHIERLVRRQAPGLDQVLAKALSPTADGRYASGAEMARHMELCQLPATRQLLFPQSTFLQRLGRRWPTAVVVGLTVIPNAFAGALNYAYNYNEIIAKLGAELGVDKVESIFHWVQLSINLSLFPFGILYGLYRMEIIGKYIRHDALRAALTDEQTLDKRLRTLNSGHEASLIAMTLWISAGLLYPGAMHIGLGQSAAGDYFHFFVSQLLCGLIAVAYPFLLISLVSLHVYVPLFVRLPTMGETDRKAIERIRSLATVYFALAVAIPFVALMLLGIMVSTKQWAPALAVVGGFGGIGLAFTILRRLQSDLDSLVVVTSNDLRRSNKSS